MIFSAKIAKRLAGILLLIFCFTYAGMVPLRSEAASNSKAQELPKGEYELYLDKYPAHRPDREIILEASDYLRSDGEAPLEESADFDGSEGKSVLTPEDSLVSWQAEIPETGLYNIEIEYYPTKGNGTDIERELLINGELPFSLAAYLTLSRVWADDGKIERDNRDNDMKPSQIEKPRWQKYFASNHMGYYKEPYLFYFEAGVNTVSLKAVKEPMMIRRVRICQAEAAPSYAERLSEYKEKGYAVVDDYLDIIEAEAAEIKSDPMMYPVFDRTSPATRPYHPSKIRLNTIGGARWSLPGQWIAWTVNVEKSGLYQITLKSRQNIIRGLYTNRKLTIDGSVPFIEMENLRFKYDSKWQHYRLENEDGEPYLFYLEEGGHELRLESVLGELSETLRVAENSVLELNNMYRRILMLTGTTPDQYRDYNIDKELPDVIAALRKQSGIMEALSARLLEITGQKGSHNSILDRLAVQMRDMAKDPDTIPKRLDIFKTNLGSLGLWIFTSSEQPLELDYIAVSSPGAALPKVDVGFFGKLLHETRAFIASFTEDYDSMGDVYKNAITVWTGSGRDQGQVLKSMIDDTFVPENEIAVNLRIVKSDVMLSAIVAGMAPDVIVGVPSSDPVNYAIRGAVKDLSVMEGFEDLTSQFHANSLVPYRFEGGIYGIPEQQVFPVLFYRKDILAELGLEIPQTWDDVIKMLPTIQKNQMEIGIPVSEDANIWPGLQTYSMLLFQMGGEIYQDGGKSSGLDTETGMEAFRMWTNFYVNYKFPMTYNAVNRLRIGEIPLAIADYSNYNILSVFAPELRGLWGIAPIPGILQKDGTIDRSVASNGSASIILSGTKKVKESWEFIKWWTEKDAQVRFGHEMESLLGSAARYPTANREAMDALAWPTADKAVLSEQWKWVRGMPEVPGGYFTPRHLDNAFRAVTLRGADPRETILDYTRIINEEIDIKRKEFGLPLRAREK